MEKPSCVVVDIHDSDDVAKNEKTSVGRCVQQNDRGKLSLDFMEVKHRMKELALTPSTSSNEINKVKTLAQLFEHGSVRDLRTVKSPEPKLEDKSSSSVALETRTLQAPSLELPSLKTKSDGNGNCNAKKSLVLNTEFPKDYRLVRKKKATWKRVAEHFHLDEKSRVQNKMLQVIKLSKDEDFAKARQEVSTKSESEKELERKKQTQRENKELACILLGLMVEAELPLKFYEMIGQSLRVRNMVRKLLENGKSKDYVIQLFDEDGGQKDLTENIPETMV
eukprot:TCONS_00014996-protein